METIENRAKEKYCANCGARTEYNCSPESTPCSYVKDYIKIATEQKAIDNKKACMNFCVACPIYENCDTRYNCPTYEKFEKAIEE